MPPPGDLPEPGIDPTSLTSPALAGGSLPLVPLGSPQVLNLPYILTVIYNMPLEVYSITSDKTG